MAHEIKIMGCLSIPDNTSWEESISLFVEFIESHNWCYYGDFAEIRDGKQVGYGVIKKKKRGEKLWRRKVYLKNSVLLRV